MLPGERYENILKYLSVHSHAKIADLRALLNVTEPTLRADLSYLESQGKLIKIRGGAAAISSQGGDLSVSARGEHMGKEKAQMAKKIVPLIPDNSVVFMDASTTVLKVAQELALDFQKHLTIITNFLDIAEVLLQNPRIQVVFCGGQISASNRYALGEATLKACSFYHGDIALLGCQGISKDKGFFNGGVDTTAIKHAMMQNVENTWICADHSKFNRSGLVKFLDFTDVEILFTDCLPPNWKEGQPPVKIITA